MQLVVHAPFGGRINRASGLALRKRFCRRFDFELQAAASDDAIVLSLGPQHSFPLEDVPHFLDAEDGARRRSRRRCSPSPMFQVRWRWNLGRALAGAAPCAAAGAMPPPIQRMEADDLMAAVFPALAGCQENAAPAPIEIPDHPLVRQTMYDCLHEATDVDGLVGAARRARGGPGAAARPSTPPSPRRWRTRSSTAGPTPILDDAPLEERRTRAVRAPPRPARRARASSARSTRTRSRACATRPGPTRAMPRSCTTRCSSWSCCRPRGAMVGLVRRAGRAGRAARCPRRRARSGSRPSGGAHVDALFPGAPSSPTSGCPRRAVSGAPGDRRGGGARSPRSRGHLAHRWARDGGRAGRARRAARERRRAGPRQARGRGLRAARPLRSGARRGRRESSSASGASSRASTATRRIGCAARSSRSRRRTSCASCCAGSTSRRTRSCEGRRGLLAVIEQLQGFEVAAGAWEEAVLPARVERLPSRVARRPVPVRRGRVGALHRARRQRQRGDAPGEETGGRGGAAPSRATPVTFALRDNLDWLLQRRARARAAGAARATARRATSSRRCARAARCSSTTSSPSPGACRVEVEEALWDLVARGLVTADGFGSVRALLTARERWAKRAARPRGGRLRRGAREIVAGAEGRWSIFMPPSRSTPRRRRRRDLAEAVAEQLLARYGVVFRDLVMRESLAVPWREILWALRRMEARGTVARRPLRHRLRRRAVRAARRRRGAAPDAAPRALGRDRAPRRRRPAEPDRPHHSGPRVPAVRGNAVTYRDGLPIDPSTTPAAMLGIRA